MRKFSHFLSLLFYSLLIAPPATQASPLSLECLSKMSWAELECLYRQAHSGAMPCGYFEGEAVYCKGKLFSRIKGKTANLAWKGKHFSCGIITNQWATGKRLKGKVYRDCSWLDGKPSIMLDYRSTSFRWRNIRDEIREIAPGVYIGIMFEEKKCERKIKAYFILEQSCCR